jgi:predicted O-methyltransferase YrrM
MPFVSASILVGQRATFVQNTGRSMLLIKHKPARLVCGWLETVNFLSLKLCFRNWCFAKRFVGLSFRTYMSLARDGQWRSRQIDEIIGDVGTVQIVIEHMRGGGIHNPVDELAYLALIARVTSPQKIFEIGTYRGRTALNLANNSPADCIVYTLDLPPDVRIDFEKRTNIADAALIRSSAPGVDYLGKPAARKIHQLFGDSTRFDFSPYFGQMDIVFVDGAHHYDAVRSDTENALKMIKAGGWILWHDFANYGDYNDVTRAVLDLIPGSDVVQIADSELACYRKPLR